MEDKDRLTALEDAHRALAAQFTALQITFRVIAPLIALPLHEARIALTAAYDTTSQLMEEHQQDEAHQAEVRHWLDVYSRAVLREGYTPQHRPNADAGPHQ